MSTPRLPGNRRILPKETRARRDLEAGWIMVFDAQVAKIANPASSDEYSISRKLARRLEAEGLGR